MQAVIIFAHNYLHCAVWDRRQVVEKLAADHWSLDQERLRTTHVCRTWRRLKFSYHLVILTELLHGFSHYFVINSERVNLSKKYLTNSNHTEFHSHYTVRCYTTYALHEESRKSRIHPRLGLDPPHFQEKKSRINMLEFVLTRSTELDHCQF
jgi:hypothetical protein